MKAPSSSIYYLIERRDLMGESQWIEVDRHWSRLRLQRQIKSARAVTSHTAYRLVRVDPTAECQRTVIG